MTRILCQALPPAATAIVPHARCYRWWALRDHQPPKKQLRKSSCLGSMWGGAVRVFLAHPAHWHPGGTRAPVIFVFPLKCPHSDTRICVMASLKVYTFCGRTPWHGRVLPITPRVPYLDLWVALQRFSVSLQGPTHLGFGGYQPLVGSILAISPL